jgi:integrase
MKPHAGRYHVGDSVVRGLRVRVSIDGQRTFSVVYRAPNGYVRTFTIGTYPEVGLAAARDLARDVKASARLGTDRQEEKVSARQAARTAVNFADLARLYLKARKLARSTRTEYARMVRCYIEGAPLGKTAAPEVRRRDLREALEAVAETAPVMANRLFQFVRTICRWAVREEALEADPSAGLERPRKEKSRDRVLTDHEVLAVWRAMDEATPEVAAAVRALLLLGQRSTETVEMRWADLDLHGATPAWTIPGDFRKGDRLHVIPLSPFFVGILEALPRTSERVFHGVYEANAERDWWGDVRARAMAGGAQHFTKHDLRRTCATDCAKLGAAPWIVSRILGHAITEGTVAVTGTYNRYAGFPEMASALNAWSAHVQELVGGGR